MFYEIFLGLTARVYGIDKLAGGKSNSSEYDEGRPLREITMHLMHSVMMVKISWHHLEFFWVLPGLCVQLIPAITYGHGVATGTQESVELICGIGVALCNEFAFAGLISLPLI